MAIQSAPLPPDVSYCIDCALEHGELDGGTHIALKLYAPRRQIIDIVDDAPEASEYFTAHPLPTRLRRVERLQALADETLADLTAEHRGAVAWAGIQHLKQEVTSSANMLATWAHEDSIIGGCMLPYKRKGTKWTERYELMPRQSRDLHSRNWIKRYVKNNSDARRLRLAGARAMARFAGIDLAMVRNAGERLAVDLQAQHEGYRRWNEAVLRQMARKALNPPRKEQRRRRRIIKRAASTAVALVGSAAVSAFAAGRPVSIPGETITLEVSRLGSSAMLGHAGLHVVAVDPASNRRLANLCVYHDQTPALDQLTALALAMKSGEEAEILQTANLSSVTEIGRAHPLIEKRGSGEQVWEPRDMRQMANEAYWQATKPIWMETLGVFVLGRVWNVN